MHNNILFNNKYRIPSTRLHNYDYSSEGAYFVTICTKHKQHFFGDIVDGEMHLSEIGKIVVDEWMKTYEIRENVELGEWVVMPNHFHAIIILTNGESGCGDILPKEPHAYNGNNASMSKISPSKNSLSNIVKFFKRQTTIRSRNIISDYTWQARFHDHIIRNKKEFAHISNYIMNNPSQWIYDSLNTVKTFW